MYFSNKQGILVLSNTCNVWLVHEFSCSSLAKSLKDLEFSSLAKVLKDLLVKALKDLDLSSVTFLEIEED